MIVLIIPLSSARETGMIVIASIHEPSYDLLQLFDNLLVLADGRMAYSDRTGSSVLASCILFALLMEYQKTCRITWRHWVILFQVSLQLAHGFFSEVTASRPEYTNPT